MRYNNTGNSQGNGPRTGDRVASPGGPAIGPWQRTAAGGLAISHPESNTDGLTRFITTEGLPDAELEAAIIAGTPMSAIEDLSLRTYDERLQAQNERRWTMAGKLLSNPLPGNPDNDGCSMFSTQTIREQRSKSTGEVPAVVSSDVFNNCVEGGDSGSRVGDKSNVNQLEAVSEWSNAYGGPVKVAPSNLRDSSWTVTVGEGNDETSFDVDTHGYTEPLSFNSKTGSDFSLAVQNRAAVSNVYHRGSNIYRMKQASLAREGFGQQMIPEEQPSLSFLRYPLS
jgi:hypothetical protein